MKVLYTGSFNPFHNGHQYVYDTACKMFGKENVFIGIGKNRNKPDNNVEVLKYSIHPITRNVIAYDCLTAKIVKDQKFDFIIRGVRPGRSLEDENDLLYWNQKLSGGVQTILIPTPPDVNQISSGAIREMYAYNEDVTPYMNKFVYSRWVNPDAKYVVFFGHCCCGKSTYLKNLAGSSYTSWDYITPEILNFDTLVWDNLKEAMPNTTKEVLRQLFYSTNKSDEILFYKKIWDIGADINWENMFKKNTYIDFPNIGSYWEFIPKQILRECMFIKLSASMEDRKYFSERRNVNPLLIERSDHFYRDPPFYDKEIVVQKMISPGISICEKD